MTDRIDPGPGWRLLEAGEEKPRGYEYKSLTYGWVKGDGVGQRALANGLPCRVRIPPRTTKAIATRATITMAFRDGRTTSRTERNDSGLLEKQMADTIHIWGAASLIGAKYIMLEIQREGEP